MNSASKDLIPAEAIAPPQPSWYSRVFTPKTVLSAAVLALAAGLVSYSFRAFVISQPVTAAGYLQPVSTAQLNFVASGPIAEVNVRPGDVIHAGQILAKQNLAVLHAQLAADQASLAADQAAVAVGLNPLRPPELQALQLAVNAAKAQLNAAQAKATDTLNADDVEIATTKANLDAAQATLAGDLNRQTQLQPICSSATSASPSASVDSATQAAAAHPTTTTSTTMPPDTTTTAATVPITVPAAPTAAPTAVADANALVTSCSQLIHQLAADQAAVTTADGASRQAVANRQADADAAEAAVASAQADLAVAQQKVIVGELPANAAGLAAAQAAVAKDNAAISADQRAIDGAVLVATSDGVVESVGGVVGNLAGPDGVRVFGSPDALPQQPSSGIRLFPSAPTQQSQQQNAFNAMATIDSLAVKAVVQVPEGDLHNVHLRQQAHITLPAMPGRTVTGVVSQLNPRAVNVGGKVYFLVEISTGTDPTASSIANIVYSPASAAEKQAGRVVGLTANVRF